MKEIGDVMGKLIWYG